jgi:hypothetical protein
MDGAAILSSAILVPRRDGWVTESDQSSGWIVFVGERSFRFGIDDRQYISAENAADNETISFYGNDPVLLVEDGHLVGHFAIRCAVSHRRCFAGVC